MKAYCLYFRSGESFWREFLARFAKLPVEDGEVPDYSRCDKF